MNPLFHTDFSISDSLKNVRKSVLIYETIIVCGKELLGRQLKFCSKACYFAGRYNRKRGITGADVKLIKKAGDIK